MPMRLTCMMCAVCTMLCCQDRATFRRIVLKSAYQKRKMYEQLLENVPMLQEMNVSHRRPQLSQLLLLSCRIKIA